MQSTCLNGGASRHQCSERFMIRKAVAVLALVNAAIGGNAIGIGASFDGIASIGDVEESIGEDMHFSSDDSVLARPVTVADGYEFTPEPVIDAGVGAGCCESCNRGLPCMKHKGILNYCLGEACPRWTGQIDVLMLWRGNVPATPLLILDDPANPLPVLSANQILTNVAVGPRGALMLHLNNCNAIEANYFNVGSIGGTREFAAPPPSRYAFDGLAGISLGDITQGTATSNGFIQSFELNWRRKIHPSVSWLAGFRWVEWNESLAINNQFENGQVVGTDLINVATANDLYGAQLGADALLLNLYNAIIFNGVAKAGIYGNPDASMTTTAGGDRIPPGTYSATVGQTGFFGEVGVNGAVRITDHIYWRTGYNFFWISGVATAAEQLKTVDLAVQPPTGQITADGSVFLYGVNTGLEFVW